MTYPILLVEEQMQDERLTRAQMALECGEMTVLPINACTWIIASIGTSPKGNGSQYTVSLDGAA